MLLIYIRAIVVYTSTMSGQTAHDPDKKTIPIGVVLMVVGFIVLLTVLAIWLVAPVYMPQPLYDLVGDYLPETAVSRLFPTPATPAEVPDNLAFLPESPSDPAAADLPSHMISAAEAVRRQPGEGDPVRIVIPTINLDAPVDRISLEKIVDGDQTYFQWPVPNEYLAGWHDNSARLGAAGNTVLNGHHNVHGEVFRDLIDLEEGAEIILYDKDKTFVYEVTVKELFEERGQPLEVRIDNAQWIAPTDDERVTLVTCWPYTDNSHRLVIVAQPVDDGM